MQNSLPVATFSHKPGPPTSGEPVALSSTSTDLDGTIANVEWDTDNEGAIDDATGMGAALTFRTSRSKSVRSRVTDNDGGQAIVSQTIVVAKRLGGHERHLRRARRDQCFDAPVRLRR